MGRISRDLYSAGLTGIPTAPTAFINSDNDQIANTAFVNSKINSKLAISQVTGNLLQIKTDGFYYGATASIDISNLYIDAVNGDDDASGTSTNPLKTIREALARGPAQVTRTIFLYESQEHLVDPANAATLRGGKLTIFPYGPNVNAIAYNIRYSSQECLNLNTIIRALDHTNYGLPVESGGNGIYQKASAFISDNGTIWVRGVTMVSGNQNNSGNPASKNKGSFSIYNLNSDWIFSSARIVMPSITSFMFDEAFFCNLNITLHDTHLTGPGYLTIAGSKKLMIDVSSINLSKTDFITKVNGATSNPYTYTNFTTNLSP